MFKQFFLRQYAVVNEVDNFGVSVTMYCIVWPLYRLNGRANKWLHTVSPFFLGELSVTAITITKFKLNANDNLIYISVSYSIFKYSKFYIRIC